MRTVPCEGKSFPLFLCSFHNWTLVKDPGLALFSDHVGVADSLTITILPTRCVVDWWAVLVAVRSTGCSKNLAYGVKTLGYQAHWSVGCSVFPSMSQSVIQFMGLVGSWLLFAGWLLVAQSLGSLLGGLIDQLLGLLSGPSVVRLSVLFQKGH